MERAKRIPGIFMFTKELTQAGHIVRFVLTDAGWHGWEIRVEEDSAIVSRAHYSDWHRVERALFAINAARIGARRGRLARDARGPVEPNHSTKR